MRRENFIKRVMAKLDEVSPFKEPESFIAADGDVSYSDVKPVSSYIAEEAGGALRDILLWLPLHELSGVMVEDSLGVVVTGGVGRAGLPWDFLRLAEVRMGGWERGVSTPISVSNPAYVLQQNPFTRGGRAKPVAVLLGGGQSGVKRLELYSIPEVADGEETEAEVFRYVPFRFCRDSECEDYMPECVAEYVATLCAARVLRVFGQETGAQSLENELSGMINLVGI